MTGLPPSRACRRTTMLLTQAVVACAGAAVVVAGAAPAIAPAPPKWLPPRDLSARGADAVLPDVAIDEKGNVAVVWAQAKQARWTIQVVDRPPGGTWSAPKPLSVPADHAASPQVAIAGSNIVAVWERYDGSNLIAETASHDPVTGAWSAPTSLSTSGRDALAPRIAVDARGDAVAVWTSSDQSGLTVMAAALSGWPPRPAPGSLAPATEQTGLAPLRPVGSFR